MTEAFYMSEMEKLLEELSQAAISDGKSVEFYALKSRTITILVHRFGLDPDDAEMEIASACGEDL